MKDRQLKFDSEELFIDGMLIKILKQLQELNLSIEIAITEMLENRSFSKQFKV